MSWITNVNKDFVIALTGSGSDVTTLQPGTTRKVVTEFRPNWMNAKRVIDYNVAEFTFRNVKGSLVKRGTPMGGKYDIELFFQGANNLDEATQFLELAANPSPWQITHPMYGPLFVQPLGLVCDDSDFNVTKVTGRIIETLGSTRVKVNINPVDTILARKLDTDITLSTAYATNIPTALISDVTQMQDNTLTLQRLQLAFATVTENAQAVRNTYNKANAAIDNAFTDSFSAVRAIQDLINLPATFVNTIGRRVNFLLNASLNLYGAITSITTPRLKRLYEHNVGTIITTMCSASVINPSPLDYRTRSNVLAIVDDILLGYNTYIENLDTLQTATGDTPDSYVPDFDSIFAINELVKFTIGNLFDIASDARQERTYRTEYDTNVILMAYRFYGLLPDDSTIMAVINENNIALNQMLQIKKGTDLIYYV